jgi:hypothetical protein
VSQFSIATDSRGVSLVEGEHAAEPFASTDAADGAQLADSLNHWQA